MVRSFQLSFFFILVLSVGALWLFHSPVDWARGFRNWHMSPWFNLTNSAHYRTMLPNVTLTILSSRIVKLSNTKAPPCPLVPPNLVGVIPVSETLAAMGQLEAALPQVEPGGRWRPPNCASRTRLAVLLPYRARAQHLHLFLQHMHPLLQKQQLDYAVYVIELAPSITFNRAMLLNIGFTEARRLGDYACYALHDVDLLPGNDRILYTCPARPRLLSTNISKFNSKLIFPDISFGGAVILNKEHFLKTNGMSNLYFGWGGEDDDLYRRCKAAGIPRIYYPTDIGHYKMIKHSSDKGNEANPHRFELLKTVEKRMKHDGLSTLKYTVLDFKLYKLYTWFKVSIDEAAYKRNVN